MRTVRKVSNVSGGEIMRATILLSSIAFVMLSMTSLAPLRASAATCTDGQDCFCDCVENSDGVANDGGGFANLICFMKNIRIQAHVAACEDWEAVTLYDGRGSGSQGLSGPGSGSSACAPANGDAANCANNQSGPLFGPPYDDAGVQYGENPERWNRGSNWYWRHIWGQASGSCGYDFGEPSTPTFGHTNEGAVNGLTPALFRAGDLWQGNAKACLAIIRSGEFDDDVSSIAAPSQPFDGRQSLGLRVRAGIGDDYAVADDVQLGSPRAIAITRATAYPDNIASSNVYNHPWKHDQWGPPGHHWDTMNTADDLTRFPFDRMSLFTTLGSQAACEAKRSTVSFHLGSVGDSDCTSAGMFRYWAAPNYSQATDFSHGQWHCKRAGIRGLGTTNVSVEIWADHKKIVSFSGLDGTVLQQLDSFRINHFSNQRQSSYGGVDQTTYRYEDNLLIRAWTAAECESDPNCGVPASCDDAGFAAVNECTDGFDNDGDALVDAADPGCDGSQLRTESPQCSDGRDNDGDGQTDYPSDPQCGAAWDDDEVYASSCGLLGAEPAIVLAFLMARRARRGRAMARSKPETPT